MRRVHILVEGQAEEAFVGRSLAPHLWHLNVSLTASIVTTKRVASGPNKKGGIQSWTRAERDLKRLLSDSSAVAVTTMLDYYALPEDVPGMASLPPRATAAERAAHIQTMINESTGDARLQSHLAVHEFEALLYSHPDECGSYLESPELTNAMSAAVSECGEPELVNDSPITAPSKRILKACPSFRKTVDGPALVGRIGLSAIRSACPHFNRWVSWLGTLGA